MGERLRFCAAVEPRGCIVAGPYGANGKRGQKDWERRKAHNGDCEKGRRIASVRCEKHTAHDQRNDAQMWPPSKVHTLVGRCVDAAGSGMVRAPISAQHANRQ